MYFEYGLDCTMHALNVLLFAFESRVADVVMSASVAYLVF